VHRTDTCGLCSFPPHATQRFARRQPRIAPTAFAMLQWWTDAGECCLVR
jgi:hypothetical protein